MNTLQLDLEPIRFPNIIPAGGSDFQFMRPECVTAAKMIGGDVHRDDEFTMFIWEAEQDRLWILGDVQCVVCYFSFEFGGPLCWHTESLLKKDRIAPFDFAKVLYHMSASVSYPHPPMNDILPQTDGYPNVFLTLESKKLLPVGARKILRHRYQQLVLEKLGFQNPTGSREEALRLLVSATKETTIATAIKNGPIQWNYLVVEGYVNQKYDVEAEDAPKVQDELFRNEMVLEKDEFMPPTTMPWPIYPDVGWEGYTSLGGTKSGTIIENEKTPSESINQAQEAK